MLHGPHFKAIDLSNTKLFVFINRSFANNKDQSSQICYVIILANEYSYANTNEFTIKGNIIYQFLTKYRHMTQSLLATKIYGIVNGFDLGFVIKQMLTTICKRIDLAKLLLILCTDPYLLCLCLVQLRKTSEKQLMIDIVTLRQLYEGREIDEIK